MAYQPAIGPQQQPRPEPSRSIPLDAAPHLLDRDDAEDLPNPVPLTLASTARAEWHYQERCACCHGESGHGGGPVSRSFPQAPDLAYATIKARSDGYIYATITLGGRAMPPLGSGLSERDRWDLVNYVRVLQGRVLEAEP
jgi:mono/diheme cytochrome c family protein